MEHVESWVWLFSIGLFFFGVAAGFALGRVNDTFWKRSQNLEKELDETQKEFQNYRGEVTQHFVTTAQLINNMSKSYRAVFDYLALSSNHLCGDQLAKALDFDKQKNLIESAEEDLIKAQQVTNPAQQAHAESAQNRDQADTAPNETKQPKQKDESASSAAKDNRAGTGQTETAADDTAKQDALAEGTTAGESLPATDKGHDAASEKTTNPEKAASDKNDDVISADEPATGKDKKTVSEKPTSAGDTPDKTASEQAGAEAQKPDDDAGDKTTKKRGRKTAQKTEAEPVMKEAATPAQQTTASRNLAKTRKNGTAKRANGSKKTTDTKNATKTKPKSVKTADKDGKHPSNTIIGVAG